MIGLEVNNAVVVNQRKFLEQALSTDPKTVKVLQKLIRDVILQARSQVISQLEFKHGDPHRSRLAVRTSVYKQILGANINIYNSRRRHGTMNYTPARTMRNGQRGGNRRTPSPRTIALQSYAPEDRGFILRFVNSGTDGRYIGGRNGKTEAEKTKFILDHEGRGWRGKITPTNFFGRAGEKALVWAADKLADLIDAEFEKIMNNNKN